MDIGSYKLDGTADAVEFCPHGPYHDILVAATYTLQEGTQPDRSGTISLFSASSDTGLQLLQVTDTVGVFDMKWNPKGGDLNPVLAQAGSNGCLTFYSLKPKEDPESYGNILEVITTENITSSMCLCLDWNLSATSVSLGLSDGSVSVVTLAESHLCTSQSWEAHEYEVWSVLFDHHQPQLVYTGSDDCRFCCWDLRDHPSNSVFQNVKSHKMGVCSIAKAPSNPNMLLTGSYDEFLRVWDLRTTSRPMEESSTHLGGGVWKIKYHPDNPDLVLAACMHNGFAILRYIEKDFTIIENYKKHGSLAYGADWQRAELPLAGGAKGGPLVATCSFYDRLLRVWVPQSLVVL